MVVHMKQQKPIVLYELAGCPYCQKVIDTLTELDLEYDSVMVSGKRQQVKDITGGPTAVPVIQDSNTDTFDWMNESDDIVEYLHEAYG